MKRKTNKIGTIMMGCMLIFLGIILPKEPYTRSQYTPWGGPRFDVTGFEWPASIILISGGLCILVYSVFKIIRKEWPPGVHICPICGKPYSWKEAENGRCPDDGARLEDLKGFYKGKYPEKVEKEKGEVDLTKYDVEIETGYNAAKDIMMLIIIMAVVVFGVISAIFAFIHPGRS